MQRRIFDGEAAVAHGSVHVSDGVAGYTAEAVLRFRGIDLVFDRLFKSSVEEDCVIVAAGAPLRALDAVDLLHVLDGFPVELIVERCEVMHRAFPLLVDVLMAGAAEFGVHEEVRWNCGAGIGVRRRRPERRFRTGAFFLHRGWNYERIADARVLWERAEPDGGQHHSHCDERYHSAPRLFPPRVAHPNS